MFAVTPVDSSNGSACAIPKGSTTTPCLTSSIQFQEPNGISGTPIDATAQLVPASASAPTAVASFPATVQTGQSVTFDAASGSSDPNNLPLTYSWQLPTQVVNNAIACDFKSPCVTTLTGASPSYTFTVPGVYHGTLTATNSAGNASTENFTVSVADPTITSVSSSANPSVYGQPVTLTAEVAPTLIGANQGFLYPKVVGSVQFVVDGSPYGQPVALQPPSGCGPPLPVPPPPACVDPDAATASITLPKLSVTPASGHGHDITAQFLGTSTYAASKKSLGTDGQLVDPAASSTTVTSSANPSVTGQPITFTAAVAPMSPGAGLPTGTVQFQFNGQDVGDPVSLNSAGTATYSLTPAHATQGGLFLIGYHSAEAVYSGDTNFAGSSGGADQSVLTDPTTTTVTSSASPSSYRAPVTFTANVAADSPGAGTPTGKVQFSFDGTTVGSPVSLDANGVATLTTDSTDILAQTGAGTSYPTGHAITAQYLSVPCLGFCLGYVPDFGQSTGTFDPGGEGQDVSLPPLTITASSPTVTYGDPAPAITPGYGGFVAGDTPASLTTAPTCATAYQQGNGVGTYSATCQGAVDSDYQIGYTSGRVTVSPASLKVTAKNASMQAGGSPPAYGFALAGFIGTDGPSSLSAQPTCVADDPATGNPVSSATPAGTYPIMCTGAAAVNYGFTNVPGTLTITRNATSVMYTGGQTVVAGSSFTAQATVSSAAAVCSSGQTVAFSLDRNPATGVNGSYPVGTASTSASVAGTTVATTGWQQGVYVITATAQANGDCASSAGTATLTLGAAGKTASGSGWYNVAGAGKVLFSLAANPVAHSNPPSYTGTFTLSESQWQLTGTVSRYVLTNGGAGSVTGNGSLSWWDPSLNKGKGGWQLVQSGVTFTASFSRALTAPSGKPAGLGVNIIYGPASSQAALPNSAPQSLGGGSISAS
jgi:large repetitive protein